MKTFLCRSEEAALQYKIKSKSTEFNELNENIREKKQKLIRTESDLSYTNVDTIKEELAQVEEKIQAEEARVNAKVVRDATFDMTGWRRVRLHWASNQYFSFQNNCIIIITSLLYARHFTSSQQFILF